MIGVRYVINVCEVLWDVGGNFAKFIRVVSGLECIRFDYFNFFVDV